MPAYPDGAAGVRLPDGVIYSGDDAPAFRAAGFRVVTVHVQCSAKIAAGDYPLAGVAGLPVTVAVDLNGAELGHVAAMIGCEDPALAVGIYNGETQRTLLGTLPRRCVVDAHDTLAQHLPGFGCFAVLT